MEQKIETVIVGGGQAGLSVSYYLNQAKREHIILEQAEYPVRAWRDDRWDSFTLVTPKWSIRLPGAEYQDDDPDGFMGRDDLVQYFDRYIKNNAFPIQCGVKVTTIDLENGMYHLKTNHGDWTARNVVIATGLFQTPRFPDFHKNIPPEVLQLPSGKYRNPRDLPPGNILVVGSSQSGCQIAEELYQSGREVYLSVGRSGRVPRKYRGKDIFDWLVLSGFMSRKLADLPSPAARFAGNPHVTGKEGGHNLNLHTFSRDGVHLLGHIATIQNGKLMLASDLKENLTKIDQFEEFIVQRIDNYIISRGLEAPLEALPVFKNGYKVPEISSLNLKDAGITTVIWAAGYNFDFSLVHLPIFDEFGFPVTDDGKTNFPGLYFAGLPWMPDQKNGLLVGVAESANRVATDILSQQNTSK
jgi:putative flavoprotein involved in K+ transport